MLIVCDSAYKHLLVIITNHSKDLKLINQNSSFLLLFFKKSFLYTNLNSQKQECIVILLTVAETEIKILQMLCVHIFTPYL